MADYAPNVTPRYKVKYRHALAEHTVQVRVVRGTTPAHDDVLGKLNLIFAAVASSRWSDFAWLSAEYTPQDTDVSIPIAMTELTSVGGAQAIADVKPIHKGLQTRFVGRGNAGSPVSLSIFGLNFDTFTTTPALYDFRITRGEIQTVDDANDALSELAPAFVAVNSSSTIWKTYANVKVNDAWLKQIRG